MQQNTFRFSNISLACLARTVLKNIWMVVAAAMICAMGTSVFYSWFHEDIYQASATFSVVSRRTSYTSSNNSTAAKEVGSVLTQMVTTDMVYENIRASSNQLTDFDGTITATQLPNSNFIVLRVTDNSPEGAFLGLQATIDQFPTILSYISSGSVMQTLRNPSVSPTPINQVNVTGASRRAALLGAAAMIALLCFLSVQRETIQTRSGARHLLDAPVIATVLTERPRSLRQRFGKKQPIQVTAPTTSFGYAEQINVICSRMEHEAVTNGSKIFLISSVGENEGKSTISGNVATALSAMGKNVAILDCDLRKPSLNAFFGGKYSASMPLNKLLSQPLNRDNLLRCMQRNKKLGLFMLLSVKAENRSTELLGNQTMEHLLNYLRIFDFVVLDTPPMGYFADTEVLSGKVDATMLVVRRDRTPAADINDAIDTLRSSKSRFLGIILNDMMSSVTEGYGYGYGYGYGHYGYGSQKKNSSRSRKSK